jgi:hypothetical protein
MHTIKYRLFEPRLAPRRTKLAVPGWAGKPEPRRDGSHEYAWHCIPFAESAAYGIELFYPFANELRATKRDGRIVLDSDWGPDPGTGINWPPFRSFGEEYYTFCHGLRFVNPSSVTGLGSSIPLSHDPVAGVLLLSGVGAWPPPDGVG